MLVRHLAADNLCCIMLFLLVGRSPESRVTAAATVALGDDLGISGLNNNRIFHTIITSPLPN